MFDKNPHRRTKRIILLFCTVFITVVARAAISSVSAAMTVRPGDLPPGVSIVNAVPFSELSPEELDALKASGVIDRLNKPAPKGIPLEDGSFSIVISENSGFVSDMAHLRKMMFSTSNQRVYINLQAASKPYVGEMYLFSIADPATPIQTIPFDEAEQSGIFTDLSPDTVYFIVPSDDSGDALVSAGTDAAPDRIMSQ
jgi:hypothetical protein